MKKLKSFESFIEEAKSYSGISFQNVPKAVIDYLDGLVGPRILAKFFGDQNFKNIALEENDELEGNPILINWDDFTFRIPFIEYGPNSNTIYLSDDRNSEAGETIEMLRERFDINIIARELDFDGFIPHYKKTNVVSEIISDLVAKSRKESNFFNVYDSDFRNTPEFQFLEKFGTKVSSTPLQAKRGVLVLTIPGEFGQIAIYPNGYLRRLGERSQVLTSNPDLNVPIYTLETLRKKLSYILELVLKSILKKSGIPSKEVSPIISQISGEKSARYYELAKQLMFF